MIKLISTSVVGVLISFSAFALEPTAPMGQGLYEQQGSNSCMFCHGISGEGGKVAAAAKLNHPKQWRSWKALGGEAAFSKDPAAFRKNLEDAVVDLILKGAIAHNSSYKAPAFDWKKAGGPFNAQMLGITAAPSVAWIKKYESRGVTKEIAARAVYLHLKSLDKDGVL